MEKLTVTAADKKRGAEIAEKLGVNELFFNNKGEFFSQENLAAFSVGHKKEQYTKIDFTVGEKTAGKVELTPLQNAQNAVDQAKKKYDGLVINLSNASDKNKTKVQARVDVAKIELEAAETALSEVDTEQ